MSKFKSCNKWLVAWALLLSPVMSFSQPVSCLTSLKASDQTSFLERARVLVFPRLGLPSSRGVNFDVRIIAKKFSQSENAAALNKEVQHIAVDTLNAMNDLGFPITNRIHFIVESHPAAVGDADGKIGAAQIDATDLGPARLDPAIGVRIPGLIRSQTFKVKLSERSEGQGPQVIVYLPFMGGKPTVDALVIAHEIAHLIETPHTSRIWAEARSDAMAFLITGRTDVRLPAPIDMVRMDPQGNRREEKTDLMRDIARPVVQNLNDVVPSTHAYHDNSTIISHVLYRTSHELDPHFTVGLIHWMDAQSSKVIADIEATSDQVDRSEMLSDIVAGSIKNGSTSNLLAFMAEALKSRKPDDGQIRSITVDATDLAASRQAIQHNLQQFGAMFRQWAKQSQLNQLQAQTFDAILQDAGI